MRLPSLLILPALLAAALPAAAQDTPRRPPADTIRFADPVPDDEETAAEGDSIGGAEARGDSVPRARGPGPFSRDGGRGPFSVEASGTVASRPARGEVVWLDSVRTPAVARRDSTRADTTRAGATRAASGSATRRDTAAVPSRTTARDSARTGRAASTTTGTRSGSATGDSASRSPRAGSATGARGSAAGDTASRTTRTGSTVAGANRTPAATTGNGAASRTGSTPATGSTAASPSPSTPRTGQGSTPARARTHTVARGETFYGIARRYGVTSAQLRAVNPDLDWEHIETGDVLQLPASARDTRAASSSGSAGAAATRTGGSAGSAGSNRTGGSSTSSSNRSSSSTAAPRTHTVAAGETLFGIARRYGVSAQAIIDANELESDQVRTGQRLTIPRAN